MIFIKRLRFYFLSILILCSLLLLYIWYNDYRFKTNPLSETTRYKLLKKENEIRSLIYKHYGIDVDIPVIISDKMKNKHFGLATYSNKKIAIYLNKKHFFESESYMIDDVLSHEYAHALMFVFNDFSNQNGGHTKRWQEICKKLNGLRCNRYVDHKDIIIGKTNIFE